MSAGSLRDHVALTLDGATATTPTSAMRWVPEPEKAPESHANARWSAPGVGVARSYADEVLGRQIEETGSR